MTSLAHKERVNQFVTIGVQYRHGGYKQAEFEGKGNWSARIKYPKRKPLIRSLGIPYRNGSEFHKKLAMDAAEKLALELYEKSRHVDPSTPTAFRILANQWLQSAFVFAEANEELKAKGLPERHEVRGGRGFWNALLVQQFEVLLRNYILPFMRTLDRGVDEADVTTIAPQDLDKITDYMLAHPSPELASLGKQPSPTTILKAITVIRHVYRYAYDKKLISSIPSIQRPKRQLKQRTRRPLSDEEYGLMISYTRNKYQDDSYLGEIHYQDADGMIWKEKVDKYRDYQYLFHLFLLVLANCGIRPPSGQVEHNLIRWSHYKSNPETGITTLYRPSEKNHEYNAVILPSAVVYWDALRKFQIDRNMYNPDGYVFAHPYDSIRKAGGWRKGDAIKSFRGQWNRMCSELGALYPSSGFNFDKGTPQSQRIVLSSLRSYFITKRLSEGDANIEKLAFATGTNYDVIMEHYFKFATEKEYKKLTNNTYQRDSSLKPKYNDDGYYIGHE